MIIKAFKTAFNCYANSLEEFIAFIFFIIISLVSIGIALGICGAFIGGVIWLLP